MQNIIGLLASIAVAALLVWSGFRTRRVKNPILKWGGAGLLALLAVAVSSASAITAVGMIKQHNRSALVPDIKVGATPELIERGKAVSDGFCGGCHSKTGTLTGGFDLAEDLPVPVGSFVSSNLTPAGALKHWSDGEVFRAIRNGVDAEGRWLTMMSYTNAGKLSDDDIDAVIAYIRSVPPAGSQNSQSARSPQPARFGNAGRRHAAKRKAGHCRTHLGAVEGTDLSIWRVYPVLSGLP